MICPHCEKNLLQRNRSRHTCGYCRKPFALDPKVEGAGLHDLRIRRLTTKLTGAGELVCTVDQLHYAAERRGRPDPAFRGSRGSAGCLGVLGAGALIGALALHGTAIALLALAGAALLGFAVRQVVLSDQPAPPREHGTRWSAGAFHDAVVPRWKEVYTDLPAGLVEDALVHPGPPVADPAFVLLCPDRTVTAFLHANRYPRRHRALLAADLRAVPGGLPVVVLHDASPQGCLLVADVRARYPGRRVLDAGLPARAVLAAEAKSVVLRDPFRAPELQLRLERDATWLTPTELAWYAEGWWSPVAAVTPKRLMAIAVRAAEHVVEPATRVPPQNSPVPGVTRARPEDPAETRRRALAVGFLTWPETTSGPHRKGTA
ncbi:hypothetical protein [Kitasatospora sp. NPDC091207]|uniref:hypothetical protein n=1 Tax=Kitasatospora sp. NPDC091207 TaxID=3364083 RepID=UPI003811D874